MGNKMTAQEFKLSTEKHKEIQDIIFETYLSSLKASENPRIIILGGQPGCGKSVLIGYAKENFFSNRSVCIINGDELRAFHPYSEEIYEKYNKKYADLTDPDVRQWTRSLFEKAVEAHLDIIFEGTMRTPAIAKMLPHLRKAGYETFIAPMAVNRVISLFSICYRYTQFKLRNEIARFTRLESHDEAYDGLLITLEIIVDKKEYSKLYAFGRSKLGDDTIESTLVELQVEEDKRLPKIISNFREKQFTKNEIKGLARQYQKLFVDLSYLGEKRLQEAIYDYLYNYDRNLFETLQR